MISDADIQRLSDTELLTWEDDIASRLVAGVDTFLLRKLAESVEQRARHWVRDLSSAENIRRLGYQVIGEMWFRSGTINFPARRANRSLIT